MHLLYYFDYNDNNEPLLQVLGLFYTKKDAEDQIEALTRPYTNWLDKTNKIEEANRDRYFQFFNRHKYAIEGTEWGGRNVDGVVKLLSLNIHMRFWEDSRYADMSKVSEKLPEVELIEEYQGIWYTHGMLKIKEINF